MCKLYKRALLLSSGQSGYRFLTPASLHQRVRAFAALSPQAVSMVASWDVGQGAVHAQAQRPLAHGRGSGTMPQTDRRRCARWSARGACAPLHGVVPLHRPCEAGRPRLRPVCASAGASAHGSGYDGPRTEARSAHRQDGYGSSRFCASRAPRPAMRTDVGACGVVGLPPGFLESCPGGCTYSTPAGAWSKPARWFLAHCRSHWYAKQCCFSGKPGRKDPQLDSRDNAHGLQPHRSKPLLPRMHIVNAEVLLATEQILNGAGACSPL